MAYFYRRKLRSGKEAWAVAYRDVDGRLRREITHASNKTLAKRILADRLNTVEAAKLQRLGSVRELLDPRIAVTLRQFSKEYKTHMQAQLGSRTFARYCEVLGKHILPALGRLTFGEINAGHIQRYVDERLCRVRPATAVYELAVLSGMFREAMKRELVDRNPVSLVKKPKVENQIVRYLDYEEERRLLALAPAHLQPVLIAAIYSGLRESELRNLVWTDVRFDQRKIVVRHTKSKRDRAVDMCDTLYETLQCLLRYISSPYVFTNPETGTKYTASFRNSAWKSIVQRAGLRGLRFHDLRHTFASRLAQAGVPLPAIQQLLGHASITMTMRYAHMAPSSGAEAVRALDRTQARPVASTTRIATHRRAKAAGAGRSGATLDNPNSPKGFGGPEGIRTLDLHNASVAFSQLNYRPIGSFHIFKRAVRSPQFATSLTAVSGRQRTRTSNLQRVELSL